MKSIPFKSFSCVFLGLVLAMLAGAAPATSTNARPNFVFILADDLGYMDIGANNPRTFYETPNIDHLAQQGVRFTQAYAACPVCSPTRASIMTGKYPARVKITDFIGGKNKAKLLPAFYLDHLPLEEVTIAEALKSAGYKTAFFGKWHLGSGDKFSPEAQGFDVNVGGYAAGSPRSYFSPYRNPKLSDGPAGESLTERLTEETIKYIREHAKENFFVYLSHYTVHIPLQAKAEAIEKYKRKAAALGDLPGPKFLPERDRQVRQVQDHPVYAAMVQSLDESVGRVMGVLDELHLATNTVVVFFSDNGGLSTAEGTPTSNVPLRGGKGWVYEGGIREPLIIRWPAAFKGGKVLDTPVISTDFYPTLLEMAGMALRPDQHVDGVSLLPLLSKGMEPARKALFWHYPHYSNQGGHPVCAVRAGDWKLIRSFEGEPAELYNLHSDPGERSNLASSEPARVKDLGALLDSFLTDTHAELPKPNPNQ